MQTLLACESRRAVFLCDYATQRYGRPESFFSICSAALRVSGLEAGLSMRPLPINRCRCPVDFAKKPKERGGGDPRGNTTIL